MCIIRQNQQLWILLQVCANYLFTMYLSVILKCCLIAWNPKRQKNVGAFVSQTQLWAIWCFSSVRCCLNCTSRQLGKRKIFLIWRDTICVVFVPKAVRRQNSLLVPIIDSVTFAPSLVYQWSSCRMWFNRQESTGSAVWQKRQYIVKTDTSVASYTESKMYKNVHTHLPHKHTEKTTSPPIYNADLLVHSIPSLTDKRMSNFPTLAHHHLASWSGLWGPDADIWDPLISDL